jgi:hypothetical protein
MAQAIACRNFCELMGSNEDLDHGTGLTSDSTAHAPAAGGPCRRALLILAGGVSLLGAAFSAWVAFTEGRYDDNALGFAVILMIGGLPVGFLALAVSFLVFSLARNQGCPHGEADA